MILNECFTPIFTEEKTMEAKELGHRCYDVLDHVRITEQEVLTVLKHLKLDNYGQPDHVLPWAFHMLGLPGTLDCI